MKLTRTATACAALLAAGLASSGVRAQADAAAGESAPYALFDSFEQATGLKLFGFAQVGFSRNNKSSHDAATGGHSNFPVAGPNDEGLQINALQIALQKQMQSNILPRITPLPGPVPWEYSWGFRAEVLYGRNGLPASMIGFDADWGVNRSPAGIVPGTNRQNYVAMPQVFAEAYFPWWQGVTVMAGRFGSGIGREIPPEFRPGPNGFYSKTYAFVSQPDQVAGVLASANLMRNDMGFLAGELGVVNGRQNWKDNNGSKSVIGALRWRSGDMQTWVDYSFMRGDEQNDPGVTPQMPTARLISARGQLRQHHSLSATLHPTDALEVIGEVVYGKQAGDARPDTIDILTGPGFAGGSYAGINAEARYRISPALRAAVRAETFRDRKGVALFPVTAVAGDFHAVTFGLKYDINKNVVLRPEIRHDWQSNNNGVKAFGGGTASRQTTLSADVVIYF